MSSLTRLIPDNKIGIWTIPDAGGPHTGYMYAGLKMVQAMKRLGVATYFRDRTARHAVAFCPPQFYPGNDTVQQIRIGYTPWESTVIDPDWVKIMNDVDQMWTTANFCREVFIDNGVKTDIKVVHHGLDLNEWTHARRIPKDTFTFFHMGEPALRKSAQPVVNAFLKVFGNKDDAQLVIKSDGPAHCRILEPFGPVTNHPRIKLVTKRMSIEELNGLYHQMDCMVYPSNGEGFGFIPFQAIGTGMPAIMTNWSGLTDFIEWGIPIDYKLVDTDHGWHLGQWAEPDFEDLCAKMEYAYESRDKIFEQAYYGGLALRQKFIWDDLIAEALNNLPF